MPSPFLYLVKCSISLSIVWIFYQVLLRRLTFYDLNRWYLLGYSLLSFFIPFVDIGGVIQKDPARQPLVIQYIPSIDDYKEIALPVTRQVAAYDPWPLVLGLAALGSAILLGRLAARWFSLRRIRQKARLIAHEGIRIYQVDEPIIPFSFGGAIYINKDLHSEKEWEEIILHEYVHIRQRHTIDILFAELMCIINWYNPFVWLLCHSIRQNLEFIADQKVLEQGLDKKKYQYHLLKVIGEPRYRLANNFNFSSLKKRIVMMNKIKSTRLQLVKFLFILPLIAVLLVAFRSKYEGIFRHKGDVIINQVGIVVDINGYKPLSGVKVIDEVSGLSTVSDDRGFYRLRIPVRKDSIRVDLDYKKEGYEGDGVRMSFPATGKSRGSIHSAMLLKQSEKWPGLFIPPYMGPEPPVDPDYKVALAALHETIAQVAGMTKRIKMTMEHIEVSLFYTTEDKTRHIVIRKDGQVESYGYPGSPREAEMEKKYGPLPETEKASSNTLSSDYIERWRTISAAAEKTFHTTNPSVRHIIFPGDSRVIVVLQTGAVEIYDMENADPKERPSFEKLYGKLPSVVPPPTLFTHTGTLAPDDAGSGAPQTPDTLGKEDHDRDKLAVGTGDGKIITTVNNTKVSPDDPHRPLLVLDGVPGDYYRRDIATADIFAIDVLKSSDALALYGPKGRYGAIALTTKKGMTLDTLALRSGAWMDALRGKGATGSLAGSVDLQKALYFVDGVEMPLESVRQIPPGDLLHMSVLKAQQSNREYGEKGKYGVVLVRTQKVTGSSGILVSIRTDTVRFNFPRLATR